MSSSCTLFRSPICLRVKTALVLITILAVSPVHSEQETIPDTAAGRVLAAWLEAFNSGDRLASALTSRSTSRRPVFRLMR